MTNYLYYPDTTAPLARIAPRVCPVKADLQSFIKRLITVNPHLSNAATVCTTRNPILIPGRTAAFLNLSPLLACTPQQHRMLSSLAKGIGGGVVSGLAEFLWSSKLLGVANQLYLYGGDGLAKGQGVSNGLLQSLDQYDRALTHYNGLLSKGVTGPMVSASGMRLAAAIERTNTLANYKSQVAFKKYTALLLRSNLASSRDAALRIPIADNRQLQNLVNLSKQIGILGGGAISLGGGINETTLNQRLCTLLNGLQAELVSSATLPIGGAGASTLLVLAASGVTVSINTPGSHAQKINRLQRQFL